MLSGILVGCVITAPSTQPAEQSGLLPCWSAVASHSPAYLPRLAITNHDRACPIAGAPGPRANFEVMTWDIRRTQA